VLTFRMSGEQIRLQVLAFPNMVRVRHFEIGGRVRYAQGTKRLSTKKLGYDIS